MEAAVHQHQLVPTDVVVLVMDYTAPLEELARGSASQTAIAATQPARARPHPSVAAKVASELALWANFARYVQANRRRLPIVFVMEATPTRHAIELNLLSLGSLPVSEDYYSVTVCKMMCFLLSSNGA